MPARTLQDILAEHPEAKRAGDGWLIRCPAHDDGDASLKVAEGDGGRLLVHCMAGCSQEDVMQALGMSGSRKCHGARDSRPLAAALPAKAAQGSTSHSQPAKWHWAAPEIAEKAFGLLPSVQDDRAAREYLEGYGLTVNQLPADEWRVFHHPTLGAGIVYRGYDPQNSPVYKFKAFKRNPKGKRFCLFLHGAGGALVFPGSESDNLVLVGGEEKGAVANQAGYAAISFLTGERCPDDEWISLILELNPPRVILANDADDPGQKANQETAEALSIAGYPADRIRVIHWPEDAPAGHDLNDLAVTGGIEAVRQAMQDAPALRLTANRPLALVDFMSLPRPKMRYWIKGVLPERGKLTISAQAKGFKTTLLIELGLCAAAGGAVYLNFKFGDPARVLLVQPELSDSLMAERLAWLMRTAPTWLDRGAAGRNLHVLETEQGRPSLWTGHPRGIASRHEVEQAIERTAAQIVLIDSLYMAFAGMDENAADQMTLALDYLGNLANRFGVAIILTHHFNKSGTAARGSSVYQGWGETDLSISSVEQDSTVVRVEALMRCAFPKGYPAFWRKPTEGTAWFELMPEDWEPERKRGGRPQSAAPELVRTILQAEGRALRWKELQEKIMTVGNVKASKADNLISEARKAGLINVGAGLYAPASLNNGSTP